MAETRFCVHHYYNSTALWKLLNDDVVPDDIRIAAYNVKLATVRTAGMMTDLNSVVADIRDGKGSDPVALH